MDGCWELIFLPALARRRLNSAGADYRATKARIRLPPENNRVSEESHWRDSLIRSTVLSRGQGSSSNKGAFQRSVKSFPEFSALLSDTPSFLLSLFFGTL